MGNKLDRSEHDFRLLTLVSTKRIILNRGQEFGLDFSEHRGSGLEFNGSDSRKLGVDNMHCNNFEFEVEMSKAVQATQAVELSVIMFV